jgi:hypothetical protein
MTRRITIGVAVFILVVLIALPLLRRYTKSFSPQESAVFTDGQTKIEVFYSRPSVKGRLIFGHESDSALVPYGKKWRTGANEATEIEFTVPVTVGEVEIPAGTYSIYTIPGETEWIVAINSNTDYWGINPFGETFDESKDIVRAKAEVSQAKEQQELFLISFDKVKDGVVSMNFIWDQTVASLPINY